jgi:type IV pilus assembly protein PilA
MIRRPRPLPRGFTLTEVMVALLVIGLLAALALPAYQSYIARSKASSLLLKYDAVRTNIGVQRNEAPSEDCAQLAAGPVHTALYVTRNCQ